MNSEAALISATEPELCGLISKTGRRRSQGARSGRVGGVFAFATGLPLSLSSTDASSWSRQPRKNSRWLWTGSAGGAYHTAHGSMKRSHRAATVPLARGLQRDQALPGMVLHPPPHTTVSGWRDDRGSQRVRPRWIPPGLRQRIARGAGASPVLAVIRGRSRSPAVHRATGWPAGRYVRRHSERQCQRGPRRRHAPRGAPAGRWVGPDMGGGGGWTSVGVRHDRPPSIPDGFLDVCGNGLSNDRHVRDLYTSPAGLEAAIQLAAVDASIA